MMAEKHVCEPPIEAAGRQIKIYRQEYGQACKQKSRKV
jgi:hypothetical protein